MNPAIYNGMNDFPSGGRAGPCRVRKARRRGFSVIETMVACTIILMVLAGSYYILSASMRLVRTARDGYAATTISNARLERGKTIPYGDLTGLAEAATVVDDYGLPTTTGRFRRWTTVSVNMPISGCTRVIVTTEVRKPGAVAGIYYNQRTMTGVFTPYDMPP